MMKKVFANDMARCFAIFFLLVQVQETLAQDSKYPHNSLLKYRNVVVIVIIISSSRRI